MSLLVPLGLLGLLGIVALIIIYIIRPNFQQKFISTTFVWKLSLKYRKKRISTNKLRNILLIICQILALLSLTIILTQPVSIIKATEDKSEVVVVIDASSSMRTELEGVTRFERAVDSALTIVRSTFDANGIVSVVIANDEPNFLVRRETSERSLSVIDAIEALKGDVIDYIDIDCSYGSSDLDGAMKLCQEIVEENPAVSVHLITDNKFESIPDGVKVTNVSNADEWNAGILDATAELEDGYYTITVKMASYGRDGAYSLKMTVEGANASSSGSTGSKVEHVEDVFCEGEKTQTVIFKYNANENDGLDEDTYYSPTYDKKIFSFKSIFVSLNVSDNYSIDDSFWIYGGQKEEIKIQYASSLPNPFFETALNVIKDNNSNNFDIKITYVKKGNEPALEGFDYYIFEHQVPKDLPSDGIIFLADPDSAPKGIGFTVGSGIVKYKRTDISLSDGKDANDPIMNGIVSDALTVSAVRDITITDDTYKVLMETSADGRPVLFYKNESSLAQAGIQQIAVMGYSVHMSNVSIRIGSFILTNSHLFDTFFPATVDKNACAVSDSITVNSRGAYLEISGPAYEEPEKITAAPATVKFDVPGSYKISQTTYMGKSISSDIFVKSPAEESNIIRTIDTFEDPYIIKDSIELYKDLLMYVALALTVFLFAEWFLQSRDNI